jgi:hypothetical protein
MPTFVFFDMSIVYSRRRLRLWAVTRTPDGIGMIGSKRVAP